MWNEWEAHDGVYYSGEVEKKGVSPRNKCCEVQICGYSSETYCTVASIQRFLSLYHKLL